MKPGLDFPELKMNYDSNISQMLTDVDEEKILNFENLLKEYAYGAKDYKVYFYADYSELNK